MARKRLHQKLLNRYFAAQDALGWTAEQMGAFIGVSRNAWNSWRSGRYHPGMENVKVLTAKVTEIEELATRPDSAVPPAQNEQIPEPAPKVPIKRSLHVEVSLATLKKIVASANGFDDGVNIKLRIKNRKVVGAECAVSLDV